MKRRVGYREWVMVNYESSIRGGILLCQQASGQWGKRTASIGTQDVLSRKWRGEYVPVVISN